MIKYRWDPDAEGPISVEWRRRMFTDNTRRALIACVGFTMLGVFGLFLALRAATTWNSHNSVILIWVGVGALGAGAAANLVIQSEVIPPAKNVVRVADGVTEVSSTRGSLGFAFLFVALLGLATVVIGLLVGMQQGIIPQDRRGNVYSVSFILIFLLGSTLFLLTFRPMGFHLEFSPLGVYANIGELTAEIPWDSIVELNTHYGNGFGHNDGIGLVITDQELVRGLKRRSPSDPVPLALHFFNVDEDTLYNVFVAAHLHPVVRQLFGTEEGRCLFDGPPRHLRHAMALTEVWMPWEQEVHKALSRVATDPTEPAALAQPTEPTESADPAL